MPILFSQIKHGEPEFNLRERAVNYVFLKKCLKYVGLGDLLEPSATY